MNNQEILKKVADGLSTELYDFSEKDFEAYGMIVGTGEGRAQRVYILVSEMESEKYFFIFSVIGEYIDNPEVLKTLLKLNYTGSALFNGAYTIIDWELEEGKGLVPCFAAVGSHNTKDADKEILTKIITGVGVMANTAEKYLYGHDKK